MSRVLVATTGTQEDERRVEKALELLNPHHEYIFLTVTNALMGALPLVATAPPVLPPVVIPDSGAFEEVDQLAQREGEQRLEHMIDRLHLSAAVEVERGDPADRICAAADEQEVDLIVIGSSDASLMQRILRGSISDQVAHQAGRPVLLMHLNETDQLQGGNGTGT
jgi:nucleotide-binding universal stress UspA family protein